MEETHIFQPVSNASIVRRKKKYDFTFERGTKWVEVPQSVRFASDVTTSTSSSGYSTCHSDVDSCGESVNLRHTKNSSSLAEKHDLKDRLASLPVFEDICKYRSTQQVVPPEPDLPRPWHIDSFQEAMLFRYYITDLSSLFDEADTEKHFAITIPKLAQDCPSLMNAILAFSAKQLSLQGRVPEAVCLYYTDACYKLLLPRIKEKAFHAAEMGAVLLLRFVQHMTDSTSTDLQVGDSFLGLDVFLEAVRENPDSSIHSAILVHVMRFYNHLALTKERPLELLNINCMWLCTSMPLPDDERQWEWRSLMGVCRAANFVYGDKPQTLEVWMDLEDKLNFLRSNKPRHFDPIYSEEDTEGEEFPRTVFANEIHVATFLYFQLSTLLLINNIPDGLAHCAERPSLEQINKQSRTILRRVCGTAVSHADSVPTLIRASSAICYAGHLFNTRAEQDGAYDLLLLAIKRFPGIQPKSRLDRLRASWSAGGDLAHQVYVVART